MARKARCIIVGCPHHVVARGVNRRALFASGFEKQRYLKRFAQLAEEEGVDVHGYCIMDNHVHWLLTPRRASSLARLFQRLHTWWAMVYNRKHERSGHLFQNRYHSTPIQKGQYYWTALRYIELNPCRANLGREPQNWEYSSAREHLTGEKDPIIKLIENAWRRRFTCTQWRDFLIHREPEQEAQLRRSLKGNRPCGSAAWVEKLEKQHQAHYAFQRAPARAKASAVQMLAQ
jgi:putative transposase